MAPPIILFGYKRRKHFSLAWQALAENKEASESELHIFLDGARDSHDLQLVNDTRAEAARIKGFKKKHLHLSSKNLGLSSSVLRGIGKVSKIARSWIVLEDDLIVSKFFLEFMHEALKSYEKNTSVASIHGYVYPTSMKLPESFFLKGADCWGWGSWSRAWQKFEPDSRCLVKSLLACSELDDFTFNGAAQYLQMLKDQIDGKNDSWAIRWYASAFLAGMYTLYPGRSLVQNIGLDSSGTHCEKSMKYDVNLSPTPILFKRLPVQESKLARQAFEEFFREKQKTSYLNSFLRFITRKGSKLVLV